MFVVHNVRFDNAFVVTELARLNLTLKVTTLCTVSLSRRLYPQHKGHGRRRRGAHLALCGHGVQRHCNAQAKGLLQGCNALPLHLETPIADIPLYVGNSVALRTRVHSHLQASTKVAREMRIMQEISAAEMGQLYGAYRAKPWMHFAHCARRINSAHMRSGWSLVKALVFFDQWCHIATAHDESDLQDALPAHPSFTFDLDIYRVQLKR